MINKKDIKGKRGGRKPRGKKPTDEFDQKIIDIARVTRVTAGGKRMRFRACVVIGDKKGKIGVATMKGADVSIAVNKAVSKAKKELLNVKTVSDSIPHRIEVKYKGAHVLLKPAPAGTGIIAGGVVRSVAELAGIKNLVGKILGSKNKINNVKATIEALNRLMTKEEFKALRK